MIFKIKLFKNYLKFTPNGKFSVKAGTWANNYNMTTHPKAKFLDLIWKLNLIRKIKLFAWDY